MIDVKVAQPAQGTRPTFTDSPEPSGSSLVSPPPFFESTGDSANTHLLSTFSDSDAISPFGGEEPPPEFTPYEAEYFDIGNGDIVSHDAHLNTDGEALYRFLLSQANTVPSLQLHCRGTHRETRHRYVTQRDSQGRTTSKRETYTENVTDFDFYIDVSQHVQAKVTQWSVADSEPAYRGRMVKEFDSPHGKRRAKRRETNAFKRWLKERDGRGLPPWALDARSHEGNEGSLEETSVLRSSKTVRQWADEYCNSEKHLKEFMYEKVIYGWNFAQVEASIRATISASLYQGDIEVDFIKQASKVYIRPDNRLSRMLSNKWLKFLSIILLIFPFIWLFKRFHPKGGGRWEVCGGAYSLKTYELVQPPAPVDLISDDAPVPSYDQPSNTDINMINGKAYRTVGLKEGVWLRQWQPAIIQAVHARYQSSQPLYQTPEQRMSGALAFMDHGNM